MKQPLWQYLKLEQLTENTKPLDSFRLSSRLKRLLTENGINTVSDLLNKTGTELCSIEGFGQVCLDEVISFLKEPQEIGLYQNEYELYLVDDTRRNLFTICIAITEGKPFDYSGLPSEDREYIDSVLKAMEFFNCPNFLDRIVVPEDLPSIISPAKTDKS